MPSFCVSLLIVFLLCSQPVTGQFKKLFELHLNNVSKASVDRMGNIYFVFSDDRIQKRDPNGVLLKEITSPIENLSLIEPWNPQNVFMYAQQTKRYAFLNHRLDTIENTLLDPSLSIDPKLMCPENTPNRVWILDEADWSLKKVNLLSSHIEVDAMLPREWVDKKPQIIYMREYQNMLFLLDKKTGIHIFTNIGKPVAQISTTAIPFFNFLGEELCYRENGKILLWNLYTGEKRVITQLLHPDRIKSTLITDERLIVIREGGIDFFEFKPS